MWWKHTLTACALQFWTKCLAFPCKFTLFFFRAFLGIPFYGGNSAINKIGLWGCWSRWQAIARWVSDPSPSTANPQSHCQHGWKVCFTPSREIGSKRSLARLRAREKEHLAKMICCGDLLMLPSFAETAVLLNCWVLWTPTSAWCWGHSFTKQLFQKGLVKRDYLRRKTWLHDCLGHLVATQAKSRSSDLLDRSLTGRLGSLMSDSVHGRSKRSWRMHEETWRFRACIRPWNRKFKVWLRMIQSTTLDLGRRSEILSSKSCRGLLFTNRDQWNDESRFKERTRWEGDVFVSVILAFGLEAFVHFNNRNASSASQILADGDCAAFVFMVLLLLTCCLLFSVSSTTSGLCLKKGFLQQQMTHCLPPGICHRPAWRRTGG